MRVYIRYSLLVIGWLFVSCTTPADQIGKIKLVAPIFSPVVGNNDILLQLVDANDNPVNQASIRVRGEMESDMPAVSSGTKTSEGGIYTIPFAWTMGGEWIVNVEATLPNGDRITEQFNIFVEGDEALCSFVMEQE